MSAGELHLRIQSDPANVAGVRQAVEKMCCEGGLDTRTCEEVGLCVNEALANVIRHAYDEAVDQPIDFTARLGEGSIHIAIRDWGPGVVPRLASPQKKDPLKPGGLGLICLNQMMDTVVYTPQSDGMLLEMSRKSTSNGRNSDQH